MNADKNMILYGISIIELTREMKNLKCGMSHKKAKRRLSRIIYHLEHARSDIEELNFELNSHKKDFDGHAVIGQFYGKLPLKQDITHIL